jgi:hypothetical protein
MGKIQFQKIPENDALFPGAKQANRNLADEIAIEKTTLAF